MAPLCSSSAGGWVQCSRVRRRRAVSGLGDDGEARPRERCPCGRQSFVDGPMKQAIYPSCRRGGGGAVVGPAPPPPHPLPVWLPLAAAMGLSPLLILTLRGPERVLVVSTEPPDDLSCLTTPGVGRPGDGAVARAGARGGGRWDESMTDASGEQVQQLPFCGGAVLRVTMRRPSLDVGVECDAGAIGGGGSEGGRGGGVG